MTTPRRRATGGLARRKRPAPAASTAGQTPARAAAGAPVRDQQALRELRKRRPDVRAGAGHRHQDAAPSHRGPHRGRRAASSRMIVWRSEGQSSEQQRAVKEHVEAAYRYLVGAGSTESLDLRELAGKTALPRQQDRREPAQEVHRHSAGRAQLPAVWHPGAGGGAAPRRDGSDVRQRHHQPARDRARSKARLADGHHAARARRGGRTHAEAAGAEAERERVLAEALREKAEALAAENAKLYQQAQQAVRVREQILAIVSHDLRNPLGTILMTTAVLAKRGVAEERRRGLPQAVGQNQARGRPHAAAHRGPARLREHRGRTPGDHAASCTIRAAIDRRDAGELRERRAGEASAADGGGPAEPAAGLVRPRSHPPGPVQPGRQRHQGHGRGRAHHPRRRGARAASSCFRSRTTVRASARRTSSTSSNATGAATTRRTRGPASVSPSRRASSTAHEGRIWAESEPGQGATFWFALPGVETDRRTP